MQVVIVGAGLMGRGIGLSFAIGRHHVTLVDIEEKILMQALDEIKKSLEQMKIGGLLGETQKVILGRISTELDLTQAVAKAEFVEEAILENLVAKRQLFAKLGEFSDANCILATNTSSLSITSIAGSIKIPERVIGVHIWNPAHLMQAVEVVRGEKTCPNTVKRTISLLKGIGKKPAVVQKDVPGQIGIRILYAMIREATWLVGNGIATPEDVDTVVKEALGTRLEILGPLELADLSGVDLVDAVAKGLYKSLDSSQMPHKLLEDKVAKGDIGIKSGKGFYDWNSGGRNSQRTIKLRDEHLMRILKGRRSSRRRNSS